MIKIDFVCKLTTQVFDHFVTLRKQEKMKIFSWRKFNVCVAAYGRLSNSSARGSKPVALKWLFGNLRASAGKPARPCLNTKSSFKLASN